MTFFGGGKNARLISVAILLVIFGAGGLAGAAGERVLSSERPTVKRVERSSRESRGGPRRVLLDEQFAAKAGLTEAQRAQIKDILDRRDAQAKQVWAEFEPRLKAFAQSTHTEIEQVLTAEQQALLEREIAERRASWRTQRRSCDAQSDSAKAPKKGTQP